MANVPKNNDYELVLREAGVRITRPRRVILEILAERDDHPNAMAIFRRAVKVDASISLHRLPHYEAS